MRRVGLDGAGAGRQLSPWGDSGIKGKHMVSGVGLNSSSALYKVLTFETVFSCSKPQPSFGDTQSDLHS